MSSLARQYLTMGHEIDVRFDSLPFLHMKKIIITGASFHTIKQGEDGGSVYEFEGVDPKVQIKIYEEGTIGKVEE